MINYHSLYVLAVSNTSTPPEWWQVTTGILAIPAAIIGLAYSFFLSAKTRLESKKIQLESKKLELEIREKQSTIDKLKTDQPDIQIQNIQPVVNQVSQYLLIRFIIIYLVINAWGLVELAFNYIFTGFGFVIIGVGNIFSPNFSINNNYWLLIPLLALREFPKFVYWFIFITLAFPLFRDVNELTGLRLKDFFQWTMKR